MLTSSSFKRFRRKIGWRFNDRSGFTLFEMMVVITIIGIVLGIAAPRLAEHYRNVSLQDAAYQICGNLHVLKSQAIRTQTNCAINFNSPASDQYSLTNPSRTVDLGTYRGNVTFTTNPDASTDTFAAAITFTPQGTANASAQVYLTNQDNYIYRVQASAAGGVSVKMWNSAGNKWY